MNPDPLTEFAADLSAFADELSSQSKDLYTRFGYHEKQALTEIIDKLTTILETPDENQNTHQPAPYQSQSKG